MGWAWVIRYKYSQGGWYEKWRWRGVKNTAKPEKNRLQVNGAAAIAMRDLNHRWLCPLVPLAKGSGLASKILVLERSGSVSVGSCSKPVKCFLNSTVSTFALDRIEKGTAPMKKRSWQVCSLTGFSPLSKEEIMTLQVNARQQFYKQGCREDGKKGQI